MDKDKLKKSLLIYFIAIISIETLITIVMVILGREISPAWVSLLTLQFGVFSTVIGICLANQVVTAIRRKHKDE